MPNDIVLRGAGSPVENAGAVKDRAALSAFISVGLKSIPLIGKFVEIVDEIDTRLREEKLEFVLTSFASRFASAEDALAKLRTLTETREGQVLFKKLVQVTDNGDVDPEWLNVLAIVLKRMTDADIAAQFSEISYALGQIDRLTPQALIILSKYHEWSGVRVQGTSTSSGQTVSGNWDVQTVKHWRPERDSAIGARLAHAFRELMSAGLIVLRDQRIALEPIGDEVFRYVRAL